MRKNTLIITVLLCVASIANSQEITIEKSVSGIQVGFFGFWVHNEFKLSTQIGLRAEVGLDGAILFRSSTGESAIFSLAPVFTIEPRWYYNFGKRSEAAKNITGNSGNFISMNMKYFPDWFVLSSASGLSVRETLFLVPTWGVRRSLGKYFNYELGIGLGIAYEFPIKEYEFDANIEAAANLHIRIGYRF